MIRAHQSLIRRVLQLLYELRYKLAHNVSQVTFSLDNYLKQLGGQQTTSFIQRAGHGIKPNVGGVIRDSFVLENPKLALWVTVSEILACLHLEHDVADSRLLALALQRLTALSVRDLEDV
ncbi:hypothetical protein [Allopusillimonas ginsengisoli]|uniref:hypothetical protein n=1 Tax=Allopusillimonas ginsengisoli TaxID=453575 RepID=UPI00102114FE|nr:hypothetical protein [Allopusillimonas ginsengisoli]TEA80156.1 hypothetical protein ERE07_04345 [Allopusillimonas ginsengisoli]